MTSNHFFTHLENTMAQCPHLFLFREQEPKATIENIKQIETHLNAKLPSIYTQFQKKFGGGNFGYTELFSIVPESEYYLFSIENNIAITNQGFFPILDDQTGGIYCFKKHKNNFSDKIYYLDISLRETPAYSIEQSFIDLFNQLALNIVD